MYFYAFDLLNQNGELPENLPFSRRRELLETLLAVPEEPLRLSPLLRAPSGEVLEAVRKLGLEGVVGKRIDSIYEPGERSGAWIKHRTNREQEFVIGGYIPGAHWFDALLVGVYENKEFIFVAKVKDWFVPRIREEIFIMSAPVTAIGRCQPRRPAKEGDMVLERWCPLLLVGPVASRHLIPADDAVFDLIKAHQTSKLIGFMRLAFADHDGVRFEQAQYLL
jgi:ATP-dependent DNA ligase